MEHLDINLTKALSEMEEDNLYGIIGKFESKERIGIETKRRDLIVDSTLSLVGAAAFPAFVLQGVAGVGSFIFKNNTRKNLQSNKKLEENVKKAILDKVITFTSDEINLGKNSFMSNKLKMQKALCENKTVVTYVISSSDDKINFISNIMCFIGTIYSQHLAAMAAAVLAARYGMRLFCADFKKD